MIKVIELEVSELRFSQECGSNKLKKIAGLGTWLIYVEYKKIAHLF